MITSARSRSRSNKSAVWVVSEVYYPELTSTGYYLTAIAEGLADTFDVRVLCGQPNYSLKGTRAPKREEHNGVSIFRASGTTLNKNVIFLKMINMLTLSCSMLLIGLRNFRRGDRVMVVTTPPIMPFLIAVASLFRGSSYTLLIHDCYPEVLVAVGKFRKSSWSVRIIDFFNRWLYKHARKIIVVGRDMKKLVEEKSHGLAVPIKFIPNWAEIDEVRPVPRSENLLIRELGIADKLVVLHAGNIGFPTDVETVVEVLRRFEADSRFHFVFIGSGVKRRILEKAIEDFRLTNLALLAPRPREEQIDFLNACDIALVSLIPNMYGAAMPSKTYNIMAAGKPVLAMTDEGSELATVVDENNIGWHLVPGNADVLTETLNEIYNSRQKLEDMGRRARKVAEKEYSVRLALARYKEALF